MVKNTLYFGNPAYLSLRNKQIVISLPDSAEPEKGSAEKDVITRPIEDTGIVILDNNRITITQALIGALIENNVAIISCNSQSLPIGLMLPLDSHTLQSERFRDQVDASLPLKKQLWQQTVQAKIRNQAQLLNNCNSLEIKGMMRWANDVRSGDPDNLEARAAVFYWSNLFKNIHGFTRARDGMPPNNLLNYGYAILRAIIARALVERGLLPTLGIHHHNKYNAYCLADDIMEPYRPYVDELVYDIVQREIVTDDITKQQKVQLLSIATKEVMLDGKRMPLMVAATQTTTSLLRCYQGEIRKIQYPEL